MSKADGGAAFPRPMGNNGYADVEDHDSNSEQEGMSLRDYFAAKAIGALVKMPGTVVGPQLAEDCYRLAEDMLAARAKTYERSAPISQIDTTIFGDGWKLKDQP